ncbi:cytochrome P450 [Fistulina hepatica ATCC 64428]|uniref:Cytochrome P450 n=1 Tax=Fistulina hepatica ATCC 64428 TaxID=1128425 RepID=A0A0D7API0_9AGAR|nr:cytochrome P450 [Fistulina hepatica ATCC 64428]
MSSHVFFSLVAAVGFTLLYTVYRRYTAISISKVPGPPGSWLFATGRVTDLLRADVGGLQFEWQQQYGPVIRVKGPLGEDFLLVSDPKALQYIYQTSGYRFPKPSFTRIILEVLSGKALFWAAGEDHKRQRKVMLPAFGVAETRAFIPIFFRTAAKMASLWRDLIAESTVEDQSAVVDIPSWASRGTMDAIGEAAFDYQFGALDNSDNALAEAFRNTFNDAFSKPTNVVILVTSIFRMMPDWLVRMILLYAPIARFERWMKAKQISEDMTKDLIRDKAAALLQGQGNRDIMSLAVKANVSTDAKMMLTDVELVDQLRNIISAGHETTANSITWTLYEIACHPEYQQTLRKEIHAKELEVRNREDNMMTAQDLEDMQFLNAVIKESLRFHPTAPIINRCSIANDVLPLSVPITLMTGEVINELPIPKRQNILASVASYNRFKPIWGEDAHTFNPYRWFRPDSGTKETKLGMYANVMSFSAGLQGCLGWRVAMLELQTFLIELIGNFELIMTPESHKIRRQASVVMTPVVDGEREKGAQLPLLIRVVTRDEE